jgi:hypothetical protein
LAEKIKRLEQAQEVSAHFAKSRAKGLSKKAKSDQAFGLDAFG